MREKIQTGLSILIILILLPYVAVVLRTGSMNGLAAGHEEPDLEDYVAGILPGEMPAAYEEEALKAQAVIARTNLLRKSMEYYGTEEPIRAAELLQEQDLAAMGFVYYPAEKLQELWGYEQWERYDAKLRGAVDATAGEFLALDGKPMDLPYHAVSAGRTRSGQVLGDTYEYLESVECPGDLKSVDYLKVQALLAEELLGEKAVQGSLPEGRHLSEAVPEILSRDEAGYVTELRLGGEVLAGEEFRSRFDLNSSCFTAEETEEGIRITTKGLGHGLGLSMYQANQQALDGWKYKEILSYFYKNLECITFF